MIITMAVLVAGCMMEVDDLQDADVGEIEQAFSSTSTYSWGDTKYSSADIGSAFGRACYMSGVAGYLTTNQFPEGSSQNGAGVFINGSNRYNIYVDPAFSGITLQTWARCVNSYNCTADATWRSGQPKKILAPVTANRRCFISKLTTGRDASYSRGGFSSLFDQVRVTNDGVNWYIDGSQSGLVWATASCIDVTEDLGEFFLWANEGSSSSAWLVPATNGATCFLTQVSGKLTTSNDWEAGPFVDLNPLFGYFYFNAKNGNGGRVRCVR